jgi:endogenous inhibitor of DNA gyrase (YacG/DUF329 family)
VVEVVTRCPLCAEALERERVAVERPSREIGDLVVVDWYVSVYCPECGHEYEREECDGPGFTRQAPG